FPIAPFKSKGDSGAKRRAFTLQELRLMYRKAPNDFWRYMIVGGTYSGLRMGDLITLAWTSVDLTERMIRAKTAKTGKTVWIPIAEPFQSILKALHKTGSAGYVWSSEAARYVKKGSGQFSNDFYDKILAPCGLVRVRE